MKRLLVSVRSAEEARIALECGVDLIDVKEPRNGPLGAAEANVWREVLAAIGGAVPVSVALGELGAHRPPGQIPSGIAFAKVGLAGASALPDWRPGWREIAASFPRGCAPVAVAYADWRSAAAPSPEEILTAAVEAHCGAVLIDTHDKENGDVFRHWPGESLADFLKSALEQGLTTVLAGGLSWNSLERALHCPADYLAVRGLACGGCRIDSLDRKSCIALVAAVHGARPASREILLT